MMERLASWNRSLDEAVDLRSLAVLRIALGPIVLFHLAPFLADARTGLIYRDRFTMPFWDWYPHLPRGAYVAVLVATTISAVAMSLGWVTRLSAWATTAGVAYNLFLSQTHFHHNRAFLLILLVGICVLPTGNTVSIDAVRARRRGRSLPGTGGSRLALGVLRIEVVTVYCASGFSKLIDPDWWGGTVTRLRVVEYRPRLIDSGMPRRVVEILTDPGFHRFAAKVIVLTELFIGIGLLVRRTRMAAVWVAIPFHVAIQLTAAVQVFSIAALAALVIWANRPAHDRVVQLPSRYARLTRALDWTGRFEFSPSSGAVEVADGMGVRTGTDATLAVLSRLPATFWFAAPIQLLRRG